MRIASHRAGSAAHNYVSILLPRLFGSSIDELAATLVRGGWLRRERYLEMKNLDPAWMVGLYVRGLSLRVIARGR